MIAGPGPVLVTGGTGFVGTALVRRLVETGYTVHVLARPTSDRGPLAELPVRWHVGDVGADGEPEAAVEAFVRESGPGARVVHGAALISYRTADAEEARRVNVEGTRRVLDACQTFGVARVVHVSSVVAVGTAPDAGSAIDEEAPFDGARLLCDYVTTKRAAEDFALAVAKQLDVVVVNPGAIFGPSPVRSNSALFLRRVAERKVGPFAPPGSVAVVGLADVAEGIRLALERGARGRRYLLTESNRTLRELLALASAELGVPAPRLRVPGPFWSLLCAAAVPWDRVRPVEEASPQALRLLGAHFRFDAGRARRELGWEPRSFAEVLAETVGRLRERGDIPDA